MARRISIAMVCVLSVVAGCRFDPRHDPAGSVDSVTYVDRSGTLTGVEVAGWAFDPDDPGAPVDVTVYVSHSETGTKSVAESTGVVVEVGTASPTSTASCTAHAIDQRADVAASRPSLGANHGFRCVIGLPGGELTRPQISARTDVVVIAHNLRRGSARVLQTTHLVR